MTVAVLGAGAGGLSAAIELSLAGHDVALWNRNRETLIANCPAGEIRYRGVLGEGTLFPTIVSTDLKEVLVQAEVVVICLPSVVHNRLFNDLAVLECAVPVVLNPGHTGGALHFREVFTKSGVSLPPVAEFSTLTYVARIDSQGCVNTTNRARQVRVACLPNGRQALDWGQKLFPRASEVSDVLASSLSNVNLVLHPPGAILGASWVEATSGNFTFYVQGMTPGVGRVMQALDNERLDVARAFGHILPSLLQEMESIGTVEAAVAAKGDLVAAIRGGIANSKIAAPDSFNHRYYQEDLAFGLLPFVELAQLARVPVPVAAALLQIGGTAIGGQFLTYGLDSGRLGLDNLDLPSFLASVRN
jgi:opine dehydrogenase